MTLFDLVIKEYVSIVETLLEGESIENNRIIIDKGYFKVLLEKYHYMKFDQKTKIYKALNFIIHDKNNYTLPCKDVETKKTVRKVVFNYNAYLTVKELLETQATL
jgi:hypothetical protein